MPSGTYFKANPMNSYQDYLQSDAWQMRQQAAIHHAEHRCQLCNSYRDISVNHNNFDRFGNEKPSDLIVLCGDCKKLFGNRLPSLPIKYQIQEFIRRIVAWLRYT